MRPFSLDCSYIAPLKLYEMSLQYHVTIRSEKELFDAAYLAARQSIKHHVSVQFIWADVMEATEKFKIHPERLLFEEKIAGRVLYEHVIRSEDWLSCSIFLHCLKDGAYADGLINKSGNSLTLASDTLGKTFGYLQYSAGSWYGGEMVDKVRDGLGTFKSKYNTSYYGGWKNNESHGYGCAETTFPKYAKDEGVYQCGMLVKPSKSKKFWQIFTQ